VKRLLALTAVLCVLAAQPLFAASDTKFKIFGAAAWVAPLDDEDVSIDAVDDTLEAAEAVGWNLGFEFRFTDRLGLELDYINSTQDLDFGGETIGEFRIEPVSASLNIHLFDSDVVDLYLAPTASWVFFNDVEFENITGEVDVDPEFAWGASIGLDIGLGERFAIVTGLRWLNLEAGGDDVGEFGIDPLIARAGLGIRF
jgi:outer membrane protein W